MEAGLYVPLSGKRKIKNLHLLGTCFMAPEHLLFVQARMLDPRCPDGQILPTCARCVLIEVSLHNEQGSSFTAE